MNPDTPTPATAPTTSPLPNLSPTDTDLLNTFLNANLSLPALSNISGQSLAQVMAWRAKPAIDAHISIYLKYKAQADDLADRSDHAAAMSTLRALFTATNPVEQRRAATMLRALAQRSRPKPREKPENMANHKSNNGVHSTDKPRANPAAPHARPNPASSPAPLMPITYNPLLDPLIAAIQPASASTASKRVNPATLIAAALAPTG